MKKIFAAVVMILIVAGVCAPFVNGLVMERIVMRSQDNLNRMYTESGTGMNIEIISYDRSFSSTEIEWRVKLGNLATVYGVDEIIFVDRADHGFTGVVSTTSLEKNQWFVDLLNDNLDGRNPLGITTTYRLWGKIKSVVDIGAFSFQVSNETVDFRPARVVAESDAGLRRFVSKASWDGLSVEDKFRIDGSSLMYDLEKISTYIWDGVISCEISGISMEDEAESFELINFQGEYALDFDREKNTLSTGGTVKIDNLASGSEGIKDAFVRFTVNNINAQGYEEFMRLYTRAVNVALDSIDAAQDSPDTMDKVNQERMTAVGLQMLAAYEKLLKEGLEMSIPELRAQHSTGGIIGNVAVQLNQDVTFAQLGLIAMQPGLAFQIFSLQSDISFPAELAGDSTMFVSPLFQGMQTGLFVPDGDNLVHSARTRNGKLLLNGNEVVFH